MKSGVITAFERTSLVTNAEPSCALESGAEVTAIQTLREWRTGFKVRGASGLRACLPPLFARTSRFRYRERTPEKVGTCGDRKGDTPVAQFDRAATGVSPFRLGAHAQMRFQQCESVVECGAEVTAIQTLREWRTGFKVRGVSGLRACSPPLLNAPTG